SIVGSTSVKADLQNDTGCNNCNDAECHLTCNPGDNSNISSNASVDADLQSDAECNNCNDTECRLSCNDESSTNSEGDALEASSPLTDSSSQETKDGDNYTYRARIVDSDKMEDGESETKRKLNQEAPFVDELYSYLWSLERINFLVPEAERTKQICHLYPIPFIFLLPDFSNHRSFLGHQQIASVADNERFGKKQRDITILVTKKIKSTKLLPISGHVTAIGGP
ncbi:spidroin 3A variant 1, partial [Trichonephila inaurata madagascariensis]